MSVHSTDDIFCSQCGVKIDLTALTSSKCPNCDSELGDIAKNVVGESKKDDSIDKTEIRSAQPVTGNKQLIFFRELLSNKLFSATIIGSIGLVLISFAFLEIISSLEFTLPLCIITLGGFSLFTILIALTLYFRVTKRIEAFSVFLLLMIGELILISTNYFVDINSSSSLNRHLILSVAVIFAILFMISNLLIRDPRYDSVHRVTLIYLSWLIILHVTGHQFISRNTLTLVIIFVIILTHIAIQAVPLPSVLITSVVLEFFILIQTNIINSVYYGVVAVATILSIPLITTILDLYKRSNKNWIMSKEAADKLAYQKDDVLLKEDVDAKKLIGRKAIAPGIEREIPILPASFCDPKFGSGIVTSVPSDAPYDYVALKRLQEDEAACKKYGLDQEDVKAVRPIPIIKSKGYGDFPAQEIVQKLGITSLDDPKLEEATKELYKAGFHTGTMMETCDKYAGMRVEKAKELVKAELLEQGKLISFTI
ncbi:MAG: class I tRNA ligase family protein [Candidatus Heimdallarchaeota archaeon]|nr:class I tRNA ligase family protein [Candidatus Heimdallarchaeota archaeon]